MDTVETINILIILKCAEYNVIFNIANEHELSTYLVRRLSLCEFVSEENTICYVFFKRTNYVKTYRKSGQN